ncbi:MAG: excinuclease ABC subunit UvrB [Vampirovibrionales bacterium]|nr:excinuclease ABC subunit UvrB [Vampirovibrionales bacterium]
MSPSNLSQNKAVKSIFHLNATYAPAGDQPEAIDTLVSGVNQGIQAQTLLGVTGSGKTFTMANVIARTQRPALILAHNKTLAAQLYNEFKSFFPQNAVEYFISYYDYYQPEAYIPSSDTYIEKSASINDEIDRLRHAATRALFERPDVIVIASVSCLYGLGLPENYLNAAVRLEVGQTLKRNDLMHQLVRNQYKREMLEITRTGFRVRGETLEIWPADEERVLRITFFDDEIEHLALVDPVSGQLLESLSQYAIFPAVHYVTDKDLISDAIAQIQAELKQRLAELYAEGKRVEAQRLEFRTNRDLDSIREVGYCPGIENYSRIFEQRPPGSPPKTLLDYFAENFLLFIDESHVTLPQTRGMYFGDRSRKDTLINYGFRLPCARDNRPLNFDEFLARIRQRIFVSATPSPYELAESTDEHGQVFMAEQIIRPTGLLDPTIEILPTQNQVDALLEAVQQRLAQNERVLITTLTKRMAEDLSEFLNARDVKVRYLHSDIKPLERVEILRDLRLGTFDVLVGVNLLREGLDLPEVSLVVIMDADKEGFLRSESSLIQTIGRAARNSAGHVLLFADKITDSMRNAIAETERRRAKQEAFNQAHGITPTTVIKPLSNGLLDLLGHTSTGELDGDSSADDFETRASKEKANLQKAAASQASQLTPDQLALLLKQVEAEMQTAAKLLDFEKAARLRDQLQALKNVV